METLRFRFNAKPVVFDHTLSHLQGELQEKSQDWC